MKLFVLSKTLWLGLIVALLPWLDQVKGHLALNPDTQKWATVVGVAVMLLRLVTTQPLTLKKPE